MKEGIVRESDVDSIFSESAEYIAALILMARVILQSVINHVLSILEPDLIKMGVKESTGIETISIKHDYFEIWGQVLHGLADEFTKILSEESFLQMKRTELKEELMRFLDIH